MTADAATAAPLPHGGRPAEAQRLFPRAPGPWVDLSTGINPVPYPLPPLAPELFFRLPEPDGEAALREAAARAFGVGDPSMVVAAPGTQILIGLLPRIYPASRVAVLGPTYAEHAHAWRIAGSRVMSVASFEELQGAEVAVVCNPNNPDGRRIAPERLAELAERMRDRLVLVDEAFADLDAGISVAGALPHPALIVLRSFGKTYGLAGLRLGFALAAPARTAAIRAALGPWAVSGPALAIGCQALADREWLTATAARLDAEVRELDALLTAAGMCVIGGTCLFRLAEGTDAQEIFGRLGRAGIFVRRFADHTRWLRFGLPGSAEAWQRLRRALA